MTGIPCIRARIPNPFNFELVATTTISNAYIRSSSGAQDLYFDSGDPGLEVQSAGNGTDSRAAR